jgi:DnaJ-class molecular chaperone
MILSSNFQERKQQRIEHFENNVKGWKLRPCTACNGSGYYDNTIRGRIPKCGSCGGTGKERYKPSEIK